MGGETRLVNKLRRNHFGHNDHIGRLCCEEYAVLVLKRRIRSKWNHRLLSFWYSCEQSGNVYLRVEKSPLHKSIMYGNWFLRYSSANICQSASFKVNDIKEVVHETLLNQLVMTE